METRALQQWREQRAGLGEHRLYVQARADFKRCAEIEEFGVVNCLHSQGQASEHSCLRYKKIVFKCRQNTQNEQDTYLPLHEMFTFRKFPTTVCCSPGFDTYVTWSEQNPGKLGSVQIHVSRCGDDEYSHLRTGCFNTIRTFYGDVLFRNTALPQDFSSTSIVHRAVGVRRHSDVLEVDRLVELQFVARSRGDIHCARVVDVPRIRRVDNCDFVRNICHEKNRNSTGKNFPFLFKCWQRLIKLQIDVERI